MNAFTIPAKSSIVLGRKLTDKQLKDNAKRDNSKTPFHISSTPQADLDRSRSIQGSGSMFRTA